MFSAITARALRTLLFAPLLGVCAFAAPAAADFKSPADIPVEHFFRPPAVAGAELNPAGTHIGMRVYDVKKQSYGLIFLELATGKITGSRGDSTYNIASFHWVGDDRVVFNVIRDTRYAYGLYAMLRDDPKNIVTLNEGEVVDAFGTPRARPGNLHVIVRASGRNSSTATGLFEIDLRKNFRSYFGDFAKNVVHSYRSPPSLEGIFRWWQDADGEIRYVLGHRQGIHKIFRREADDRWSPLPLDTDRDVPLAVDADPAVLLVAHRNDQGLRELRRLDTRTGSLGPVLHTDDKYDFSIGRVRFTAEDREMIGLLYPRQATEQVWFREAEVALQRSLDASLPADHLNLIISRSRNERRFLALSAPDRHPGTLYFFDREKQGLRQIAQLAPWLPEHLMAPVRLLTFKTRDGLKLDGYITLPLNYAEGKPTPTIVLPHGGPWVRDAWGYDAKSQFFASRGYVVFQPNYRGSIGYNAAISQAPRMEFRKMHDDVTDGVRALIAAKIADPAHLAIYGASFGGYLAMSGAAFEPGLYKCAITFAGVFDWAELMEQDKENGNDYRAEWFRRDLGDPEKDRAKFEAMSPLSAVANVRIPIFVAHGKEDRNANTNQSRSLVRALKKAGVPHEAWFIPDEAHGLAELKHRIELYTRIEAFLKKHL